MEKVFRDWVIKQSVGEGAFGKVYRIEREDFGHVYQAAMKVIEIPQHQTEIESMKNEGMTLENVTEYFYSMVENIVEEFTLMSKLKGNSNIVSYEDHEVTEKEDSFGWTIKIRMELLTPLFDYIQGNDISKRDIIQLGIDICKALEVCGRYHIIHRDIKPENIFISDIGTFKLGDFGIARELEKTSSGLSKKGTKGYMAPEVYRGYRYNATADIYSLGIVLYRFLNNNRMPFMPPSPEKIKYSDQEQAFMMRYSGQDLPKPANADDRLAEIVCKACAYVPDDRYRTASDLRIALEELLEDSAYVGRETIVLARDAGLHPSGGRGISEEIEPSSSKSEEDGTVFLFHPKKGAEYSENESPKPSKDELRESVEEPGADSDDAGGGSKEKGEEKENAADSKVKNSKNAWLSLGCVAIVAIILGIFFAKSIGGNIEKKDEADVEMASVIRETMGEEETPMPTQTAAPTSTPLPTAITSEVYVPNVTNISKKEAEQKLAGLNLRIAYMADKYSNHIAKDRVISQNPEAGAKAQEGSSVAVTLSKGRAKVTVPSFMGMMKSKVKKKAKSAGLHVMFKSDFSSNVAKGKAMRQSIKKGKKVNRGTAVTVTVSRGRRPVQATPKPAAVSRPRVTPRPKVRTKKPKAKKKPKENKDDYDIYNPTFG